MLPVMETYALFQNIKKDIKKFQRMFEIKDRMSQSRASKVSLLTLWSWNNVHLCCGLLIKVITQKR